MWRGSNPADTSVSSILILIKALFLPNNETDCRYVLLHEPQTVHFDYSEATLPVFPQDLPPAQRQDITAKKVQIYLPSRSVGLTSLAFDSM